MWVLLMVFLISCTDQSMYAVLLHVSRVSLLLSAFGIGGFVVAVDIYGFMFDVV